MAVENGRAPVVVDLSADEFRARLDEALAVYVAAMGYPSGTEYHRAPMWSEHVTRPGWGAVCATVPGTVTRDGEAPHDRLVGVAYAYRGAAQQWWHQQVYTGMRRTGWRDEHTRAVLGDYVELTELHVHPSAQGHRLGEAMLWRLLDGRPEANVLLSTPEVADENNRAWRLYRRLGFRDVIRSFTFTGDSRRFAVLGRALPLSGPPT